MTLRTRLSLFYGGLLTLALLLFGAGLYVTAVMAEEQEDEPQAEKERELHEIREQIEVALIAGIPLGALLAVLGSSWMTRRTLRTLSDIVATASEVGPEKLHQRIAEDPSGDAETERLVGALNGMFERLDRAVNGLRRFTADAAHELRTPLASIMGELEIALRRPRDEAALRATMEGALEGLTRLTRLLEVLLTLARSDAGELPISNSPVNVSELLAQVASPYEGLTAELQQLLRLRCEPALLVRTDPLLLGRAVANLLDNACKFSKPGGSIELGCQQRGQNIEIFVADTGPGLSAEDEVHLFQRFYRSDLHRGRVEGFGLGLALAHEFISALGGQVSLCNRTGGGTQATIVLRASH